MKFFSGTEQKAMLLKRQAFAVFSGEPDQYHLYLPLIQGKSSPASGLSAAATVAGDTVLGIL